MSNAAAKYEIKNPLDLLLALEDLAFKAEFEAEGQRRHAAETAEKVTAERVRCRKCDGTGRIQHYRHVANGCCFACDGTGKDGYARG